MWCQLIREQSKAVTHFTDQLNVYELPTSEVVEWSSYDGLVLQGVVVSPHGQPMSPDRPTIVDLHGGPIGAGIAISQPIWNWLVPRRGFKSLHQISVVVNSISLLRHPTKR